MKPQGRMEPPPLISSYFMTGRSVLLLQARQNQIQDPQGRATGILSPQLNTAGRALPAEGLESFRFLSWHPTTSSAWLLKGSWCLPTWSQQEGTDLRKHPPKRSPSVGDRNWKARSRKVVSLGAIGDTSTSAVSGAL